LGDGRCVDVVRILLLGLAFGVVVIRGVAELVGDDELFVEELMVVVVWGLVVEENTEAETLIR
jgi:hypothetical protein